jgi:hypothetical protein
MHNSAPTHPAVVEPIDYIVVVSNEDDHHAGYHQFAEKVNRKLKAGYQLHGPPFSVKTAICQAMVRHGESVHSGDTTIFSKQHGAHHA